MVSYPRRCQKHHPRYCLHQCHHRWFGSLLFSLIYLAYLYFLQASCCNEAFKIATTCAPYLNNYFMLIGTDGIYSYTFEHERRPDCPVCGGEVLEADISKEWTVDRLIEWLAERQDLCAHNFRLPHCLSTLTNSYYTDKSKSHLCRQEVNQSIFRLHRSSNYPLDQTWRKRYPSWSRMLGRLQSRHRHFLSI
jgi:hypothetical protein